MCSVHDTGPALSASAWKQEQRPNPASSLGIFPSRHRWAGQCHVLGIAEERSPLLDLSLHLICTTGISVAPVTPLVTQLPCQET